MKKSCHLTKKSQTNPQHVASKSRKLSDPQSADEMIQDFSRVNFLVVTANQEGQRIDNFLLARLKGLPRSHLYRLIRNDEIRVNKKRIKPHDRVSAGDVVRIAPVRLSVRQEPVISDEFASSLLNRIIFEDEGLIVFNKPQGMAVHGGSAESFGVIEAMRMAMGKKYLELIHRIDKDTSGLLLIAKKRSTLKQLQDNFRKKTIKKSYLCLATGHVKVDEQFIDKPLLKYVLAGGERRTKVSQEGKSSQTHVKTLARFDIEGMPVSLVLASPLTGRTHQIRVHMASIGHALLGDDKYLTVLAPSVPRLCLHAWRLTVPNDDGSPSHFTADIPSDMANLFPKDSGGMIEYGG